MKNIAFLVNSLVKTFLNFPFVLIAFYIAIITVVPNLNIYFFIFIFIFYLLKKQYLVLSIFLVLAFFYSGHLNNFNNPSQNHILNFTDQYAYVTAVVESVPFVKGQNKYTVIIPEKLNLNSKNYENLEGKIRLTTSKYNQLMQGDKIHFYSKLEKIENFADSDFDYVTYLKTLDVYATVKIYEYENLGTTLNFIGNFVVSLRNDFINNIKQTFYEPHASLLAGMLIGTREEFADGFGEELSITGTTHVIAVSGYNVTLIIVVVLSFAGIIHRKLCYLFAFLIISLFLLIVGTDNLPALRATIMGYAFLTSMIIGRKGAVWSSIAIAVILMLFINPFWIYSLSFQLSFLSTLGLILISPAIKSILQKFPSKLLAEELSITISAILATFPIIFINFGSFSITSPIANVLVGPLIPVIMFTGLLSVLFTSVFEPIGIILKIIAWIPLELFTKIINFFSNFSLQIPASLDREVVSAIVFGFVFFLTLNYWRKNHEKVDF